MREYDKVLSCIDYFNLFRGCVLHLINKKDII